MPETDTLSRLYADCDGIVPLPISRTYNRMMNWLYTIRPMLLLDEYSLLKEDILKHWKEY